MKLTADPCKRCGAPAEQWLDIDFRCNRRRCAMRGALNAKAECMAIAMEGPESMELKRKGLKVILDATLNALRNEGKVHLDA